MAQQIPVAAQQGSQAVSAGGQNPALGLPTAADPGLSSNAPPTSRQNFYMPGFFQQNSTDLPGSSLMRGGITPDGRMGTKRQPQRGPGPAAGDMFGPSPTSPIRETPGWPTNFVIPYAKIPRAFPEESGMTAPQRGQIVITHRDKRDAGGREARGPESRRYSMLNVAMWNATQAKTTPFPQHADDVQSAEEVWENWTIEGVVRTEEGQYELPDVAERGRERLLNSVIRGHVWTRNVWAHPSVQPGTALYLVLKKESIPSDTAFTVRSGRQPQFPSAKTPKGSDRSSMPFQLSFYADHHHERVPHSVLEYTDEYGQRARGKALYLGRMANHMSQVPRFEQRNEAPIHRSVAAMLSMPECYVHVDIDDA